MLEVVAQKTGYPAEMIGMEMELEADLGIDSIKRMEILAAFQQSHGLAARDAFQDAMEKLTAMKTLRESASALARIVNAEPAAAAM